MSKQADALRYKVIIIGISAVAVAILCLWLAATATSEHALRKSLYQEIASVLLISGIWTIAYEFLLRSEFLKTTEESTDRIVGEIKKSSQEGQVGLTLVDMAEAAYDYQPVIREARDLCIVVNDGRSWISHNSGALKDRFADQTKKTVFFVLHPESDFLITHSTKVDATQDEIRSKIEQSIKILKELSTKNTRLEVWGHKLYNPFSLFLGEKYAIMCPYKLSKGRDSVPHFRFEDVGPNCYYQKLRADVENLYSVSARLH